MKNKLIIRSLLLLLLTTSGIIIFFQSCDKPSEDMVKGYLTVEVADNNSMGTPVPDVEILVNPGNLSGTTNSIGFCTFTLDPGDYSVIADVCCIGPSNIHYDESLSIVNGDTTKITLMACLQCL